MPEIERTLPPYQQIARHLRKLIHDGELRPGDALPSERQLSDQWGVARATAARALATLKLERLVESRVGVGTVVREHNPLYRRVGSRHGIVARTGRIYLADEYSRLLVAEMIPATEITAQALGVEPEAPVMHRRRVTVTSGVPMEVSSSYFDGALAEQCPLILGDERIPQGTAQYVQDMTGRVAASARDRVGARLATPDECAFFDQDVRNLPEHTGLQGPIYPRTETLAVMVTEHTLWDTEGRTITFEVAVTAAGNWTDFSYSVEPAPVTD
jgi:DNA-binding GntR family transcriptional regulator